jgi:hypothetical protein
MGIGKGLNVVAGAAALVLALIALPTAGFAATGHSNARGPARHAGSGELVRVAKGSGGSSSGAPSNKSNNWSGYNQGLLEKGHAFNAITGDWVVPKASPHKRGEEEFSASWVGIGGGCVDAGCLITDSTLIQAGTEQDIVQNCTGGFLIFGGKCTYQPQYSAWFELIPAPSVTVNLPVTAGNHVHVDIHEVVANSNVWSITIKNISTGQAWQQTLPYTSTHATAEWIEETPVVCCPAQVGPMPNLGKVTFDPGTANGANPRLVSAEEIQLVDFNNAVVATPSAPDSDTDGFNDCTYSSSCAPPSS